MKTTTLPPRNLMNRSPLRAFLLIPLVLACFALSPQARAVCQEGCDPVNFNTFLGDDALLDHSGVSNTAVGWHALKNNANASWNTAIGTGALENNGGYDNTATGVAALGENTGGHSNTATGSSALSFNTTGSDNTATGFSALGSNTTGSFNVANGMWALNGNRTGVKNTATGYTALDRNTTGNRNTATGFGALARNTTGNYNIAVGFNAGAYLTTGGGNIDIANPGVAGESYTIRIGTAGDQTATFIAGIRDIATGNGDAITVVIDSAGQLGTLSSSQRFKKDIKPMEQSSEAILGLKPATFHYKGDAKSTPQFGLIAEDVAKVNPDLVARDAKGEIYTVRYEAVNAMLLNEFLKQHRKVQEQEATITELKSTVAQQQKDSRSTAAQQQNEIKAIAATVKEQAAQIQKVSAQLEASETAPQVVNNNQ